MLDLARMFLRRVTQNRSFDTEAATSSYATGFVVDDERGIIVTNRHVVTPGVAQCTPLQCRRSMAGLRISECYRNIAGITALHGLHRFHCF